MQKGLFTADNEELYQILLSLRARGRTRNLPKYNLMYGEKSDDPFEESFSFVLPVYNLRSLEMGGRIGVEHVKRQPSLIEKRRKNGKLF